MGPTEDETSTKARRHRPLRSSADIGRDSRRVACGLASGAIQAGVFNPYDRALYLSVQHKRAFLCPANFANPYQGFSQSIVLRMVSSGLYFPLEGKLVIITDDLCASPKLRVLRSICSVLQCRCMLHTHRPLCIGRCSIVAAHMHALISHLYRVLCFECACITAAEIFMPPAQRFVPDNQRLAHFLAGTGAGAVNAIVMNPATAVKYAMWDSRNSYVQSAVRMWRDGGARPFLKGITATLARDCTFGGVFASLRYKLAALYAARRAGTAEQQQQQPSKETAFVTDLIAAAVATTASSPFNYIRNIQYGAASTDRAPSGTAIVSELLQEVSHGIVLSLMYKTPHSS
jgi:Mitochondrial carrier protein